VLSPIRYRASPGTVPHPAPCPTRHRAHHNHSTRQRPSKHLLSQLRLRVLLALLCLLDLAPVGRPHPALQLAVELQRPAQIQISTAVTNAARGIYILMRDTNLRRLLHQLALPDAAAADFGLDEPELLAPELVVLPLQPPLRCTKHRSANTVQQT
jgi:hypothetical protein